MKKLLLAATAALLLAASHSACAQTVTPGIGATQANQTGRIRQGVQSGELTPAEAARLRARKAGVRQEKEMAKADGVVTTEERKEIRGDQRRTSRAIYRQKHDGQAR